MDRKVARRLENDDDFNKKLVRLVSDYIQLGENQVNSFIDDYDVAHDMIQCYSSLTRTDLENLEKGHPKRFILPMTSTQITTMATYIAQVLFGGQTPNKVEARNPDSEESAELMNQLLRWNSEQQPTYLLGYLWVENILTYNRGILYDHWSTLSKLKVTNQVIADEDGELDEEGNFPTYSKIVKERVEVGGFTKLELVSPYDWYCDPSLPLLRMQEMRFTGHRLTTTWTDLERRSKLDQDNPEYVLPSVVEELKKQKSPTSITTISSSPGSSALESRTAYERSKTNAPLSITSVDKHDGGPVDVQELWVRLIPADYEISDEKSPQLFQFILANKRHILAVNESTYAHDMYPYSVAEGRPSGFYQFTPSWVMLLRNLQCHVDYLKNRHQEALARTVGNIFIARTDKVDLRDFLNPEKEGVIIPLLPEAVGTDMDDIIKQVPINDLTREFPREMQSAIEFSEKVTAVSSTMQGETETNATATASSQAQQMSAGRLQSIARMLSVQGLVPQTVRIVSNFQQFLKETMVLRLKGDIISRPERMQGMQSAEISRDTIQGEFDYIPHDGTMPGSDSRKLSAMTRLLEASAAFPDVFTPGIPGNIDLRKLLIDSVRMAGFSNVEKYVTKEAPVEPLSPMTTPGAMPQPGTIPAATPLTEKSSLQRTTSLPSVEPPRAHPGNV